MKKHLLVDFVYFSPLGHLIEALRYTLGYHRANSDCDVSLVVVTIQDDILVDLIRSMFDFVWSRSEQVSKEAI